MVKIDSNSQQPDLTIENAHIKQGRYRVAGVDEAGRGPWAGPVVAAAVILDHANIPPGLNDSKKLSPAKRDQLFEHINATAQTAVVVLPPEIIDDINILQATMRAMQQAVENLPEKPDAVLIDGNRLPQLACTGEAIIKGDARSLSIAAASIIAKVTRDRIMQDLDKKHPGYGFAQHKGYGTKAHAAALEILGPCPAHRKSFAPVKIFFGGR